MGRVEHPAGTMTDVTPRRANHEGTRPVKLKGRDLYWVRVMLDGRRHDFYAPTGSEAAAKARAAVRDHEAGLKPLDPRYTVGDWLRDWLRLYVGHLARRTRDSYTDTVRLYLAPRYPKDHAEAGQLMPGFGRIRLARLHQDDVSRLLAGLKGERREELSPTTRRYVYSVLRIALGEAMRQERVHRNVATLVTPPMKAATVVSPLSGEAVDALMVALAKHKHRALIVTALTAGLREGELLGLVWSAVDLPGATLEVRGQLERGTHLITEPKRESRRRVDLPAQTVEALTEHRRLQRLTRVGKKDWDPRDFVFTTPEGQALTAGMPRRVLRAALGKLKLPLATTHALRHTFATMHLEAGTPLPVVSKLLGHRSVSTTSDIYGHLTPTMNRDAADAMGRRLRRAK